MDQEKEEEMRNDREYSLCKALAVYLRLQYPKIVYHFDPTGLGLSKAQAGRLKAIQGGRGWPDLFITEPRGNYHGLFLELKAEGTDLFKKRPNKDGTFDFASEHIAEQDAMLERLKAKGYAATFACSFNEAVEIIDAYLSTVHNALINRKEATGIIP